MARDVFVSLCMIAKNEERYLARALASAKPVADELIVADTGSTDATVQIARDHGARVVHFDWIDDFAAARNASLRPARGEWVVVLDADEYFAPGHAERLRRMLETAPEGVTAYRVYQTNLADESGTRVIDKSTTIRVFRNRASHRYQYPIHEQVVDSLRGGTVEPSDIELLHSGFIAAVSAERGKPDRNRVLLERFLGTLPEGHPHLAYVHMQLGTEYRRIQDSERAFEQFSAALADLEKIAAIPHNRAFGTILVNHYVVLALQSGRADLAYAAAQRALDAGLTAPSVWFSRGWADVDRGNVADGVRDFLWSIVLAENSTGREEFVSPTEMENAWFLATQSLLRVGAMPAAAAVAIHALRWAPDSDRFLALASAVAEVSDGQLRPFIVARCPDAAVGHLMRKTLAEGRLEIAAALCERAPFDDAPDLRLVAAKVAMRRGQVAQAATFLQAASAVDATRSEASAVLAISLGILGRPLAERLAALEAEPDVGRRAALTEIVGGPSPATPPGAAVYDALALELGGYGLSAQRTDPRRRECEEESA